MTDKCVETFVGAIKSIGIVNKLDSTFADSIPKKLEERVMEEQSFSWSVRENRPAKW